MAKDTVRSQLAAENRKLIRNLKRRIHNLNKKYGATPATSKLISMGTPLYTKGLTLQQLKDQKRDLIYISGLKTSYVKGMKSFTEHWEKIDTFFKEKGEYTKDKFWEIYNKFVEEHAIMHAYKYDITEIIYANMQDGKSEEQIYDNLNKLFNAIQYGEETVVDDSTRLFYIPTKKRS